MLKAVLNEAWKLAPFRVAVVHIPASVQGYWDILTYPSGHMIYIGNDNIKALVDDIRLFLSGKKPE
ncbi:MAG: hypothetical protein MSS69_02180 [Spirochaetales bacterium]|nr:hypothetical protein [Spirochaetales bacterium]